MKATNFRTAISAAIANGNYTLETEKSRILDKITTAINWAWENWEDSIVKTFYEGEKPERPTAEFVEQWIYNEDFEADGYDEEQLKNLFE